MLCFGGNRQPSIVALIAFATWACWGGQHQGHAAGTDTCPSIFQQQDGATVRKLTAAQVQRSLNQSVDPCRDFYEFACGGEAAASDVPDAAPLTKLRQRVDSTLDEFLTEPAVAGENVAEHKIKTFYRTCLEAKRNGPQQQTFFAAVVQNNSGFPAVPGSDFHFRNANSYNWQVVIARLHNAYDMNILLGISVGENHQRLRDSHSFYFTQPATTIPSELCHREATARWNTSDKVYKPIFEEVAENLRGWLTLGRADADRVARSIVDFEYELCSGMEPANDQQKDFNVHTMAAFRNLFGRVIDFPLIMKLSFDQEITIPAVMTNSTEKYCRHLLHVLNHHNSTTVANYIMYRTFDQLSLPKLIHRKQYCLDVVKQHFPKLLDAIYQRKFANDALKSQINEMYDRLKSQFNKTSLHAAWFDDGDRGKLKFNDVHLQFAPQEAEDVVQLEISPNYWQNLANVLKFSRQHKLDLVLTPHSASLSREVRSYDPLVLGRSNRWRVEIGWALLQPPLYNGHYPKAMTYATLGHLIAAELVRIFDHNLWASYTGQSMDWHVDTIRAYGNHSECYRRQLSNYLYNNPMRYQNKSAVRDIIVKAGGLNVAFFAYLHWLHFLNPSNDFNTLSKETLPHFNFSNTQLFFIAYAQMGCRRPPDAQQAAKARATTVVNPRENHSVERYAVNGPLMNSIEFARDFRCPVGSPMNPVDKCFVY